MIDFVWCFNQWRTRYELRAVRQQLTQRDSRTEVRVTRIAAQSGRAAANLPEATLSFGGSTAAGCSIRYKRAANTGHFTLLPIRNRMSLSSRSERGKSMKRTLLLFLASTFLAADYPSDATVKEEWKRLEGSWTVTKAELLGKSLLQKDQPAPRMTIKDGKITSDQKTAHVYDSSAVKLDPTPSPKTITIPDWTEPERSLSWIGIYEVKADELKICIAACSGKANSKELERLRPKAFDSNQGVLLTFKRETK